MTSETHEIRCAALLYGADGWPVLPLRGKKPTTAHGVYDASTDPDQIGRWWADRELNVGIAVPEWYLVIDVDPRNGGVDTLRGLSAELGSLPDTRIAHTGSEGLHLWFRTGLRASEIRGSLGAGLDVKKFGGYVVAPPSIHPATGRVYLWADDAEVAVLPERWAEAVRRPAQPKQIVQPVAGAADVRALAWWWCSVLRHTAEGHRNHQLFVSALRLAERRCLTAEVEHQLIDAATDAGLDAYEIERTLRSAKEEACGSTTRS